VPVTVVAAAAGLAVVGFADGDEITLSTSRQSQEFVELALVRSVDTVCGPRTVRVPFAVTSHLEEPARLQWRLTVDAAGRPPPGVREPGAVLTAPAVTRGVRTRTDAPRGAYDVTVSLAGRPELIRVHCQGTRR